MTFLVEVYDNVLIDLVTGHFNATTNISGLLLNSTYVFDSSDALVSDVSGDELSGGSYTRFGGPANFTVAQVNDEIQYQILTPAVTFSSFTAADWRYIILYNTDNNNLYLCLDTQESNVQAGTPFTVTPGTDPFLRLLAP